MDLSDPQTGRQDMARFRKVIDEAHAYLTSTRQATQR
jgi:hypothetical protein